MPWFDLLRLRFLPGAGSVVDHELRCRVFQAFRRHIPTDAAIAFFDKLETYRGVATGPVVNEALLFNVPEPPTDHSVEDQESDEEGEIPLALTIIVEKDAPTMKEFLQSIGCVKMMLSVADSRRVLAGFRGGHHRETARCELDAYMRVEKDQKVSLIIPIHLH